MTIVHSSINRMAFSATLHCLTGCAIGEVLGMVVSTTLAWGAIASVTLSIALAFFFGYALSIYSLLRHNIKLSKAVKLALVADTASIATMELVDNAFILLVPGAIHAGLNTALFWLSLVASLIAAFIVAYPLNRYLISRGRGHAVLHKHHHTH